MATLCLHCNTGITDRYKKFCNSSCSASYNNSRRIRSKWTTEQVDAFKAKKPKTIYTNVCCCCSSPFQTHWKKMQMCSAKCRKTMASLKRIEYLRNTRRHSWGPDKQSYMEKTFEEWLISLNIRKGYNGYLSEVHFYNPNTKKNGFADFVLPRRRLIIELDGTHHIKRKQLDDIRDSYLKSRGWMVYRIPIAEYKSGKHKCELLKLVQPGGIEPLDIHPSV